MDPLEQVNWHRKPFATRVLGLEANRQKCFRGKRELETQIFFGSLLFETPEFLIFRFRACLQKYLKFNRLVKK